MQTLTDNGRQYVDAHRVQTLKNKCEFWYDRAAGFWEISYELDLESLSDFRKPVVAKKLLNLNNYDLQLVVQEVIYQGKMSNSVICKD